ncbi:MAG: 2-keto-4-pentenoate hydratase [Hyphomicrobiales bacterium]
MTSAFEDAARHLLDEHDRGAKFTPVAKNFGATDLNGAYDIQDCLVPHLIERHGSPCGYKVGLTSKAMQDMCGIDQPIAGVVLANRVAASGAKISLSDHGHAGIEFEIAVRLVGDLGAGTALKDVEQAVDGVAAAFEIIDDRHADYAVLDVRSLIADNSWNAAAVIGTFVTPPKGLADVPGVVALNGETLDQGYGSAALGHPYEPVRWLANHLAERGSGLRQGDVVLTGSLVRTRFPSPGETYDFDVAGIGAVQVAFVA